MGSQVENVRLTILPKKGKTINTCQLLKQNPRWRQLPQMNVARSGHALVVIEQVIILTGFRYHCITSRRKGFQYCLVQSLIPFFTFCWRLSLLSEVTQILQNGQTLKLVTKTIPLKQSKTLASVFHIQESGFSLPTCHVQCGTEADVSSPVLLDHRLPESFLVQCASAQIPVWEGGGCLVTSSSPN